MAPEAARVGPEDQRLERVHLARVEIDRHVLERTESQITLKILDHRIDVPARYRPSVGSESTLRARSDLAGREAGRRTDRILAHPGTSSRHRDPKVALSASSAHPSMLDSLRCLVRVVAAVAVTATAVAAPVRTATSSKALLTFGNQHGPAVAYFGIARSRQSGP